MLPYILYGLALALLGATLWVLLQVSQRFVRADSPQEPPFLPILHQRLDALEQRMNALEDTPSVNFDPIRELLEELGERMDSYERDLEEGLDVARRREARIRQTVRRAQTRMEEEGELDPAFVAEVEELQRRDGAASPGEGVQPVPEDVGGGTPSSIPGVTVEQLRKARMM